MEAIARMLGEEHYRKYVENEATEQKLKKAIKVGGFGILHLAMHGVYRELQPQSSLLAMVIPGEQEDGLLEVREVYTLPVKTELVTLSACSTGLGFVSEEEGVLGFARTFIYAGASEVIAALWDVDDAGIAKLMEEFYKEIAKNASPNTALFEARKRL